MVRNRSHEEVVVRVPIATAAETGPVALDGRMQYSVSPSHWRFVGTLDSFGVFQNTRARGWAWVTGPGGGAPPPGASVAATSPAPDGSQRITVRSGSAVDLVRSMSWTPGWRATARPIEAPAPSRDRPARLAVTADGLVQQVALPAGSWAVTFEYRPASAVVGITVSAVSALLVAGWLAVDALGPRSRRRRGRKTPADGAVQAGERRPMASAART